MSILIMSHVWKHAPVDGGDLLILLALADWADDNGRCFPSTSTIANKGRMSKRNAQRCLQALETNGLIRVESGAGPKGCNVYFVDVDGIQMAAKRRADAAAGDDKMSPPETPELEGDDAGVRGDKIDMQGVTKSTGGDDAGVTQTIIEPPENLSDAQARARGFSDDDGSEEDGAERSSIPGTADFEKRVMQFCKGRGFELGEWQDWDGSSPSYIARMFAKLDEGDRKAAERWRDAYLYDIKARGRKPVPVGIYFRDRLWEKLDGGVLERFERRARAAAERPEKFAPAYGPVHGAMLWRMLVKGPERPDLAPENGFWMASALKAAWPELSNFWLISGMKGGVMADDEAIALADAMEFVPAGSHTMADWRAWVKSMKLPELRMGERGAYLPRGGPDAIDEFIGRVTAREAAE